MRKIDCVLLIFSFISEWTFAQEVQRVNEHADTATIIKQNYQQGVRYKNGDNTLIDYTKSTKYFKTASDLGDPQSTYAYGYMLFKGLSGEQNYKKAATLFLRGANSGRVNSCYFMGLAYRNGYGVDQNEDSANYWLHKAANAGYEQAWQELKMKRGERPSSTPLSSSQLSNLINSRDSGAHYFIVDSMESSPTQLQGSLTGFLLGYDWSGQYLIDAIPVTLSLKIEEQSDSISLTGNIQLKGMKPHPFKGRAHENLLVFDNSWIAKKDHYSPERPIRYNLQSIRFAVSKKGDSIFLLGNVKMFSPGRKEPSKPSMIALSRKNTPSKLANTTDSLRTRITKSRKTDSTSGSSKISNLMVYPNPFSTSVNIEFMMTSADEMFIQLYDIKGALIKSIPKQKFNAGKVHISLEVNHLPQGTYILRLIGSSDSKNVKVIAK